LLAPNALRAYPARRRERVVDVVVDVDVDVVVDGDGDGDDLATQLGQHGDNPSEELGSLLLFALVDNAEDVERVDDCGALHGRAPRNRVVSGAIGLGGASGSFCDVERNRQCRSAKLFGQGGMALRQILGQLRRAREKLDGAPIDIELLETEHDVPIGRFRLAVA
jgi:hypothetical protein